MHWPFLQRLPFGYEVEWGGEKVVSHGENYAATKRVVRDRRTR